MEFATPKLMQSKSKPQSQHENHFHNEPTNIWWCKKNWEKEKL